MWSPPVLTLIRSGGNRDLRVRVQGPAEERRICICNGFLEAGSALKIVSRISSIPNCLPYVYLCGRVLVALHSVQSILRSVNREFRRVIAAANRDQFQYLSIEPSARTDPTPAHAITHKNPWPMFTIGWTGEAAAASLTIDLKTSH